jgi:predicted HTH transcriptional regulator
MNLKKYDEDFVKSLLKSSESQTLDFKQTITSKQKIARTMAAMANTDGGFILVGLSDQKKIIGIDPEEERYMIASANELYCVPSVALHVETITNLILESELNVANEKNLLLVEIKKSVGPKIYVKDLLGNPQLYMRIGDQTKHIL